MLHHKRQSSRIKQVESMVKKKINMFATQNSQLDDVDMLQVSQEERAEYNHLKEQMSNNKEI